mmetsp:Transcript_3844/g.9712  ORF Transcript_3844/g.9712 Transcript_3844/m.9712 type:complete len:1035 (-) Transcript_3844:356-3460(-)
MFKQLKTKLEKINEQIKTTADSPASTPNHGASKGAGLDGSPAVKQSGGAASVDPPPGLELSAEEQARLEATPRTDLIDMLLKQRMSVLRRKRRMVDLAEAYKAMSAEKEKLEEALEHQQDAAATRSKEQSARHKTDIAAKDKLIAALRQRLDDAGGKSKELMSGLEAAASDAASLKDKLAVSQRGQKQDDRALDQLKEDLEEKQNLARRQSKKISDLDETVTSLQQRNEELQMLVRQKEVDLVAQTERTTTLRETLETRGEPQSEMEVKLQTANTALEDKESALATAVQQRVDLESQVSALESQLREQATTSKRTVAAAEAAAARRLEVLQKELDNTTRKSEESQSALNEKLSGAMRECSRLKDNAVELSESHERELSAVKEQLTALRARSEVPVIPSPGGSEGANERVLLALQANRQTIENLHTQLAQQRDAAERERSKLLDETNAATDEIKRLTSLLSVEKGKVSTIETQLRTTESLLDTEKDARRTASKALEHAQTDLQELEQRHATAATDLQSERVKADAHTQLISTLERTIAEKESLYGILKKANEDLNAKLIAKSEEVISAGADAAALRIQLESATQLSKASKDKTAQEKADFDDQVLSLKAKVLQLKEELSIAKVQVSDVKDELLSEKNKCRDAVAISKTLEIKLSRSESACEAARREVAHLTSTLEKERHGLATENRRLKAETERAVAAEAKEEAMASKCLSLAKKVDTLENELGTLTTRLKKEQASAASFQYTSQTQEESLQRLSTRRDELETVTSEQATCLKSAEERIELLEYDVRKAEAALTATTDELNELRQTSSEVEVRLGVTLDKLTASKARCEQLEGDSITDGGQIQSLTADLSSEVAVRETQGKMLKEQEAELRDLRAKAELHRDEVETLRRERSDLADLLATTIEQHQRASKLQQQHAAELKRTLQKSLRGQLSATEMDSTAAVGGSSRATSGESTPRSSDAAGPASPHSGSPQYPVDLETNQRYLKNVVLKFMTGRRAETRHLVTVIGTMLRFTPEEIDKVHKSLDEATASWLNWS